MRRHRRNFNVAGHAHELTFSCYRRFPFLARDRTCEWLAGAIDHARRVLEFDVWAWVFMPDHVHLVVFPRRPVYDIAVIRRLIKEPVAKKATAYLAEHAPEWLPKIERLRGGRLERLFWQSGGGYDRNITEKATLLAMIDYLHDNPLRKGLVTSPRDWKWSSAAWFVDQSPVRLIPDRIRPEWLLDAKFEP
jgi:putative transposase